MGGQAVVYPSIGATASRPYSEVYGSPMPVMVPGGSAYGHATINASPMQRYQPNLRQTSGRRGSVDPAAGTRSPLLEEFRANKTRKWELSVCLSSLRAFVATLSTGPLFVGDFRLCSGVQWGPAWIALHPAAAEDGD